MPTGLTKDLVLRYLYNSIKWHTFGDLERTVELRQDLQVGGDGFGGEKRALEELDINIAGVKRTKLDDRQRVRICSGNTRLWEDKLAECKKKGYRHLDEFWQDYQLDEETEGNSRISLKSLNICMNFIGRLTSGENIERVMGLIRAERLRSRTEVPELTPDDLTSPTRDPNAALFSGLLKVYRVQHQTQNAYAHRNVLMSEAVAQVLASSAVSSTSDMLRNRRDQEVLLGLILEVFGKWSQIHWDALGQNVHRWLILIQHPMWRQSSTFGLGLLLPMSWEWNVEHYLAEVNMATWSWFIDRLHLICPNLHKLAYEINDYGRAIVDYLALPPLLEMEIQPGTDLIMITVEEVGSRLRVEGEEARRIVKLYECLARRPLSWQHTFQLAQQHL
jgi:hypothetical protein